MKRIHAVVITLSVAVLLGFALWLRVTSLGSLPEVDGDETWHAIQIVHMLRGEPFSIRTEHGLPLSPFHAAMELPLLLAFRPSLALIRVPTVITGILAVWMTFLFGSRIFDRLTATIAAVLLAVLPVTIIFSRTGYESSHAPLYGVVLIYLAYRHRIGWLCLGLSCCYFVHPTNIFLLPVLLTVMSLELLRRGELPSRCEVRNLFAKMAWPTAVVVCFGIFTLVRPITDKLSNVYKLGLRSPHDWLAFWRDFGRLFLATGRLPRTSADRSFWAIVFAVLVPGVGLLIRRKRWDILALLASVFASSSAIFVVGGSGFIQPGITRYGLFLVLPSVFAFACVLRELLVEPADRIRTLARRTQEMALVAAAAALLMSCDLQRVRGQVMDGPRNREQSTWTIGDDREDARKEILRLVASHPSSDAGFSVVITPDFTTRRSMQYLALPRPKVKVVEFSALGRGDDVATVVDRQLRAGAFVILPKGHPLEPTIRWLFSPYDYETVPIRTGTSPPYMVYRVRDPEGAQRTAKRDSSRRRIR